MIEHEILIHLFRHSGRPVAKTRQYAHVLVAVAPAPLQTTGKKQKFIDFLIRGC
jgi:hypothetical protein